MSLIRSLRELVLGETWAVPAGVAATIAGAVAIHALAPGTWSRIGELWLLGGTLATLLSVTGPRSGRRSPPGR